ncbi:MAG TPA: hypothetical protein VK783_14965 [Bacteroidia bacterium]|jgi:hypothetical protein|nr:hypothetical protein [Bacteroidia bacterium]
MVFRQAVAICISVILSGILSAQTIVNPKLDTKLSVLNERAYFNFPAGTASTERTTDIMSAPHNVNEETRIVYSSGAEKLVFFAQELYLVSDRNLFKELCNDSAYKVNFTSKEFSGHDSMYSILSTPVHYDSSQTAILINSLLVQTPDSSLFRVDAYINAAAFTSRIQFQALTENIFHTLSKGVRTMKRNEKTEEYYLLDSTQAFYFHLPFNYCITVDQAYDFKVFKFHKFRKFTDNVWGDMLIYIGNHPSYVYMDYGLDEANAMKDSSLFLSEQTQWMFFSDNMQGIFLKEQVLQKDDNGAGAKMHVAMITNDQGLMPELTKIAEDIKLLKK